MTQNKEQSKPQMTVKKLIDQLEFFRQRFGDDIQVVGLRISDSYPWKERFENLFVFSTATQNDEDSDKLTDEICIDFMK